MQVLSKQLCVIAWLLFCSEVKLSGNCTRVGSLEQCMFALITDSAMATFGAFGVACLMG